MKDPIVVSKSTNLASCLEILEAARAHMAVVTDKENKFLGIITMEDIIAEFSDESSSELLLPESSQEQKSAIRIIAHKTTDKIFLHMNYTSIIYVA